MPQPHNSLVHFVDGLYTFFLFACVSNKLFGIMKNWITCTNDYIDSKLELNGNMDDIHVLFGYINYPDYKWTKNWDFQNDQGKKINQGIK